MGIKKWLGWDSQTAANASQDPGDNSGLQALVDQQQYYAKYGVPNNPPISGIAPVTYGTIPPYNVGTVTVGHTGVTTPDWQREQLIRERYLPKHAHQAVPAIDHALTTISQTVFKDSGILPEEDNPILVEIMEKLAEAKELSKKLSMAQGGWRQKLRIPEEVKKEIEKNPWMLQGGGLVVSNAAYGYSTGGYSSY